VVRPRTNLAHVELRSDDESAPAEDCPTICRICGLLVGAADAFVEVSKTAFCHVGCVEPQSAGRSRRTRNPDDLNQLAQGVGRATVV